MKFPEILKDLRISRDLTQEELSSRLSKSSDIKISKSAISMYENGNREPDIETLELLADFFNVDINYLTGNIINHPPTKEDIEFLSIYNRAKEKNNPVIKALVKALEEAVKLDEQVTDEKD